MPPQLRPVGQLSAPCAYCVGPGWRESSMPPCRHSAWYWFFCLAMPANLPNPLSHIPCCRFAVLPPAVALPMAGAGLNANDRSIPGLVGRLYLLRLLLAAAFCLRRLLPRHGQCQAEPVAPLYNNVCFGNAECRCRAPDGALNPGSAGQPASSCRNHQPLTPWALSTRPAGRDAP